MFYKIIIISQLILNVSFAGIEKKRCLLGYMTDVQQWVDENGDLTGYADIHNTIDVSSRPDPLIFIKTVLFTNFKNSNGVHTVTFLSLAKCGLSEVPDMAMLRDSQNRDLTVTIKYYTLYGNTFGLDPIKERGPLSNPLDNLDLTWADGFRSHNYTNLLELDLRRCSINFINDLVFINMPKLKALYLGENLIHRITAFAFTKLPNLQYLDLSGKINDDAPLLFDSENIFLFVPNLKTLDLSYTKFIIVGSKGLLNFGPSLRKLSLCYTKINYTKPYMFKNTSLKIVDVSGNLRVLNNKQCLNGIEHTLEIVYAVHVNLKSLEVFEGFKNLEVLKLSNNDLSFLRPATALGWEKLKILDLDSNRFSTWYEPIFSLIPNLLLLSLRKNNINFISDVIMNDLENITYISLANNVIICNCHTKELTMLAYENDKKIETNKSNPFIAKYHHPEDYNIAYEEFNYKIEKRTKISESCMADNYCEIFENGHNLWNNGKYTIFDYNIDDYQCLLAKNGSYMPFIDNSMCEGQTRITYDQILESNRQKLLMLLLIPPNLILIYLLRKRIKFFCLTMRNSTLLSMMEQPGSINEDTLFNYDVFVSYCNEDRSWVLDVFLPQIERESGISVCLHERDFQVGLSILENIVSCMDRSRCIMLLLSQKFLISRWCQFEMHLAQHRLLETRREDLILILLEDIPRNLRPNTLHYLMMTKTYIVWPKDKEERKLFWSRLKKSLVTQKMKYMDKTSMA